MGIQVFVGLPKVNPPYTNWGGSCGVYRGFEVRVYDTSRPRPHGSDNPWSKYYKYYPAEGAKVTAVFRDPYTGWSKTITKYIPKNQPKEKDIAWVQLGTAIPCDICKGRDKFYVDISVSVEYKGYKWHRDYPKELLVVCPQQGKPNPYVIEVLSSDCKIYGGKVCSEFWLGECETGGVSGVHIGLYVATHDNPHELYKLYASKTISLVKGKRVRVCFDLPENYPFVAIALVKAGTQLAPKSWVCSKRWYIRL